MINNNNNNNNNYYYYYFFILRSKQYAAPWWNEFIGLRIENIGWLFFRRQIIQGFHKMIHNSTADSCAVTGFPSRTWDHISWLMSWYSSVPPVKLRVSCSYYTTASSFNTIYTYLLTILPSDVTLPGVVTKSFCTPQIIKWRIILGPLGQSLFFKVLLRWVVFFFNLRMTK
jgi:hypothetical protein